MSVYLTPVTVTASAALFYPAVTQVTAVRSFVREASAAVKISEVTPTSNRWRSLGRKKVRPCHNEVRQKPHRSSCEAQEICYTSNFVPGYKILRNSPMPFSFGLLLQYHSFGSAGTPPSYYAVDNGEKGLQFHFYFVDFAVDIDKIVDNAVNIEGEPPKLNGHCTGLDNFHCNIHVLLLPSTMIAITIALNL